MNRILLLVAACTGFASVANAGEMQRIGHTTLLPRNSNPDDKGLYAAVIDPTNGYAYFVGNYLFKLDITGNLPVQVGPAVYAGQPIQGTIDVAAGYAYFGKVTLSRYSLGIGTNPVTAAGTLSLAAGSAASVAVDDSDPNPANHYAYVLCTTPGSPAKVAKVSLATFTELNSIILNSDETNFLFGTVADAQKGYVYFVTSPGLSGSPHVLKVKMTPGTNAPVRIGAVDLGVAELIDGGCIDTVHGYAYYGTYNSDTNVVGKIFKVKLESGDVSPTLIGHINLHPGEARLAGNVVDPVNGFVYFANDNTYPGGIYQLNLNGTNLPTEIRYFQCVGGPQTPPPNGITASNTTTNSDGILPYGEVFFRSGVFDSVRGYAYFGQDSRPNQVVKIKLAQIDPIKLSNPQMQSNGAFKFSFTNIIGAGFTSLMATNIILPLSNWIVLGSITDSPPGQYEFTAAASHAESFFSIRSQ